MKTKTFAKKGQVITIVLFVAILVGVFVLVQFSRNAQVEVQQGQTPEEAARNALNTYAEQLKNTVTTIIEQSARRAAYESAANAVDAESMYFVSYAAPTMPDLEEAKLSVESRTKMYCNEQLENLQGQEFGTVEYSDTGALNQIQVWVDAISLGNGENDESFIVSGDDSPEGMVIYADPVMQTHAAGEEFTVDVKISQASDVYGFSMDIAYDPSRFEYVDVDEGDFLNSDGSQTFGVTPAHTSGQISNVDFTRLGSPIGSDGDGTLVTLNFRALTGAPAGPGDIMISRYSLLNPSSTDLPASTMGGQAEVSSTPADPVPADLSGSSGGLIRSSFEIDGNTEEIEVDYSFSASVQELRYWYMYRTIKGWVEQSVLTESTCNHMPIVKGNASNEAGVCFAPQLEDSVVEEILDDSMGQLQARFDGDVTCTYEVLCRNVETQFDWKCPCDDGQDVDFETCIPWPCQWYEPETPCVSGNCGTDALCENPTNADAPPCQDQVTANYTAEYEDGTGIDVVASNWCPEGALTYSEQHSVRFTADVTCVDNKFTDPTHDELTYNFMVHMYLERGEEPDEPPCPCVIGGGGAAGGTAPLPQPPSSSGGSGSGTSSPPRPG